ncbi:MAG: GspH/FimT family pseudopilin [Gammaproteobacteria bacterium]
MNPQPNGFTLTEAVVVTAITGIVLSFAIPAYRNMIENSRLYLAAETFKSDLQFARTEALKISQNIVISRNPGDDGSWCYGMAVRTASKSSCDCSETNSTESDFCELKRINGGEFPHTNLEPAGINNNTFSFRRGTTNAGGATFSTDSFAVRVVFSIVGRVRLCTPDPLPTGKQALPKIQTTC